ncbi:ficolin-2-like [Bufo bufo]|uniref:ficolin-2-like n=1 Tax=Bufo bufo TaxID=8384 RepID=UPI001ABDE146|nr:ficolin-2-like [Bufo bufo]
MAEKNLPFFEDVLVPQVPKEIKEKVDHQEREEIQVFHDLRAQKEIREIRVLQKLCLVSECNQFCHVLLGNSYHEAAAQDCKSLLEKGFIFSDWYIIFLDGNQLQKVLCDMHTDGGGWAVIQRRYDGSVDFQRDWESYKMGLGSRQSEFWLGNDIIHKMTSSGMWELRIDLQDFDGKSYYAKYSSFEIKGEAEKYKLSLGEFIGGNAGDSLSSQNGMMFSNVDQDNDADSRSCVDLYKGAWWYSECHRTNLNGQYRPWKDETFTVGMNWKKGKGNKNSFKSSEMKIRPVE